MSQKRTSRKCSINMTSLSETASALIVLGSITVIDGDTLVIDGERVRLHGVDAPEINRPECPAEADLGRQSKAFVEGVVAANEQIELNNQQVKRDRYGRVVGKVSVNGRDLGEMTVGAGYAAPWDYDGGEKKPEWCE